MTDILLPTTVVGSYPQPDWLVDRALLRTMVPRVRVHELWRVKEPYLAQAQDDGTILAIRDMERAGIDIITDGEMRRESYSNRFATALDGIDNDNPAAITNRAGRSVNVPRVVGKVRRKGPVEVGDMEFLRRNTARTAKITLPGPFTMAQQAKNEFYKDADEMVMDFAAAVNEEAHDLQAAGADVIQIDDPWLRNDPDAAKRIAVRALDRALARLKVPTVVHLCFGYAAVVPTQAGRLFVPAATGGQHGRPDLHRGGAAQARPRHAERPCEQDHRARRHRPGGRDGRDAGGGGRPHPRRVEIHRRKAARSRAGLRHEIPLARGGLRQAQGAERRAGAAIVRKELD